ncbi:capsule assembly Wzi family protein [Algoriphagus chordae]|nr:capsule assembly Wzi family protein [Algoriphagus chordae]
MNRRLLLFLTFLCTTGTGFAQNIPLGFPILNDYLRREQVMDNLNSNFSFNYKPILVEKAFPAFTNSFLLDTVNGFEEKTPRLYSKNKAFKMALLPLQLNTVYNSSNPYGWGNGAIIPARGLQTLLSAGVSMNWGNLSVQLYPQFHWAQNLEFEEYPKNAPIQYFQIMKRDEGGTEKPVRFVGKNRTEVLPGNSHIQYNFGSFATGISTENISWGPGQFNSLLLSDNAEGFLHFTLKTTKPAKTFIGSFEGQYFMGKLDAYGGPYYSDSAYVDILKIKREISWRYFTGISISYNPKWTEGLSIGFSRTFQVYRKDMEDNFKAWFPIFAPLPKEGTGVIENIKLRQDQHVAVFARWVVKKANAEFYFEFLRNDHPLNWRDLFLNSEHSSAYILGFNKGFKIEHNKYIFVRSEYTHTQAPLNNIVREGGQGVGVYYNGQVKQGLTQKGQILGAGPGQSGNHLILEIRKANSFNSTGITLERLARDQNFYTNAKYANFNLLPWVDLSAGVFAEVVKGNLLVSGNLKTILSKNKNWLPVDNGLDGLGTKGENSFSIYSNIKIAYIL